jgi:hypothetical protein
MGESLSDDGVKAMKPVIFDRNRDQAGNANRAVPNAQAHP